MDIVLLRTMAMRSKFTAGVHEGRTIEELMVHNKAYLRWAYYKYQQINYNEEILTALGILPEFRIPKPGTSKDMYFKLKDAHTEDWLNDIEDEEVRNKVRLGIISHHRAKQRNIRKKQLQRTERAVERLNNIARLTWKNQGH